MVVIVLFLCVIRLGIFDNSHKRNVTYHKIPSVPELKKLWLQRIRREETSGYLSANDIINWIFKMALRLIKRVYNALQTLGHWLRHVCLCIVLLTCKEPLYWSFILVSGDQTLMHLATIFYQLLSIGPFPKKLAPKTSLQGPLWPSS